jgi:DNA-binding CsgD family transcriptional regulator
MDKVIQTRSEPGVIIFNIKKQISFLNQVAFELLFPKRPNGHGEYPYSDFKLPKNLSRIHAELKPRRGRYHWNFCPETVYLKKIILIRNCQFLVRAFIIMGTPIPSSTQFLVLIDKVVMRSKVGLKFARVHFNLSSKEFEVVQLLIGGRTNKEIAKELHIAECTVKEYLRTVMSKVGATTRAGVVAQVLTISDEDRPKGWNVPFLNARTPGIRKSTSSHVSPLSEQSEGFVGQLNAP